MRLGRLTRHLAAAALALCATPALATDCKLALALGLDISSSVNEREYRLQIDGLADALSHELVKEAILRPEGSGIAVITYEWSGYAQQDLITGWTMLDSSGAIDAYAARLKAHERIYSDFPTAVGKAVEFGARLFDSAPPCQRRTMDLSGDGENNDGVDPDVFRAQGLLDGITINGLVILGAFPNPAIYYRGHVMQGPNAFVALARDFEDYRRVMLGKLLREIDQQLILGEVFGPDAADIARGTSQPPTRLVAR
ncbi:MAG: DUF1194 domain-containing protein [Pseudomonadota bacterium]